MYKFEPVVSEDLPTIADWASKDIDVEHSKIEPSWWLTAALGSLLSFRIVDDIGPVCFVRFEDETPLVRFHTQFASPEIVPKARLVPGMLAAFKVFFPHFQKEGFTGAVFMTTFPDLAAFMQRNGFSPVLGTNDFKLFFQSAPSAEV
jgi:hypothetical protein